MCVNETLRNVPYNNVCVRISVCLWRALFSLTSAKNNSHYTCCMSLFCSITNSVFFQPSSLPLVSHTLFSLSLFLSLTLSLFLLPSP